MAQHERGIFESPRASGIWHICYYDADHKRHRDVHLKRSMR
jgi:hypothetical protein